MIYDTAVIGAGVTGAAVAWQLGRYDISTIVIDKAADCGFGVSKANSGIIHGGFHHSTTSLKAKLEVEGNLMIDAMQHALGFPYVRTGILVAAFSEEEMQTVEKLYKRGLGNGLKGLELCSRERMLELEPKLQDNVVGGFYAPNGGTIEPYRYVFALMENAMLNGVEFRANTKIVSGVFKDGIWQLSCEDGSVIEAKYVVNAAGLFADEVSKACGAEEFTIRPRKGEEYLLDRSSDARPAKVIFPVPSKNSKGVLVIPTPGGTTMIGPTADMVDDKEDVSTTGEHFDKILAMTRNMVKGVERRDVINAFSGLRPAIEGDDFYIAPSEKVPNFIQAAGIQSPGLTASPAIGVYIKDLLKKCGLILTEKSDIIYENPPHPEVRSLSDDQISELAQKDPAYTRIICRCEQITEAEIIDAVKCGHTTVDGVKFHTRAGMGRCQGGFCSAKILEIISRESGIPMQELTKRGANSRIISGQLGSIEVKL